MPLFNYGRVPGRSPSGRGINPETGRIGSMPGGMDYLAGLGPAPAGVVDTPEYTNVINRRLASPVPGLDYYQTKQLLSAVRSGLVGPESQYWNRLTSGQQDFANNTRNTVFAPYGGYDKLASLAQSAQNAAPTALPPTSVMTPSGRGATVPGVAPQVNFGGTTTPGSNVSGTLSSFDSQWNDQNDPGGLIRKWQSQQANQPWAPNFGGNMYGMGQQQTFKF